MDIYRSQWIIPIKSPPIEDGLLAVDKGRIMWLGASDRCHGRISSHDAIHDLGNCILLPGLINTHTHLDLTGYRGRLPQAPLFEWIEKLITLRRADGAEVLERDAVRTGVAESLAAGVTCIGDITRNETTVEVLKDTPIRMVCFLELISGASRPPNDLESLRNMLERLMPCAESGRLMLGLSPHAPYTVTREDCIGLATLARASNAPLSMHLLETSEEVRWLTGRGGPIQDLLIRRNAPHAAVKPDEDILDTLERAGILVPSSLLVHVNYVTDDQIDRLAAGSVSVTWCPRSSRYFGHTQHRWREMLKRGVNVCLGTDSAASNETLSILDEMRCVRAEYPDVAPETILEMATLHGAKGLGLDPMVGSLRAGKRADFIQVPIDTDEPSNPIANLLDGKTHVESDNTAPCDDGDACTTADT
ncbi:MAG: amidohydrolase family protein, partial [Phycisphaerae bacterium]